MDQQEPANELARIVVPEVVDFEIIQTSLIPSIDKIVARADGLVARVAAEVKDEASMAVAVREADYLRDNGKDLLEKWREEHYMEVFYRPGEIRREVFDSRAKRVNAHIKTLMNAVADCKEKMKREARLAKERAEAEAKRQREEADRLAREAAAAEARAKQAAEDEKRRKLEAEAAEKRRVAAEAEAKERREREAREAAALETKRKIDEEETARLRHAEVAQEVGNGEKVESILDTQRPISGVLGKAEQAGDAEAVRLEQENAKKLAEERAKKDAEEAAAAEARRQEAEAAAFRAKEEAAQAAQAAASATAAAAAVPEKVINTGTTSVERKKWDLESDGTEAGDIAAVKAVLKAILDGVYPIEYCGYNPKRPQDWRPSQIQTDIASKDKQFMGGPGIRVYTQVDEQQKRRVGGPAMKRIPLTQGQVALVDDDDFARFGHLKWCALWSPKTKSFYAVRRKGKKIVSLHSEIIGNPPRVDHENHDTLDDRRHNLRACTHAQNIAHRKGRNRNSSSGIRGVRWDKSRRRWRAEIRVNYRFVFLGRFILKSDAVAAYTTANRKYFGEFGGSL